MRKSGKKKPFSFNDQSVVPWVLVAPFIITYLVFQAFPMVFSFVVSLCDWNGVKLTGLTSFIGFQNYADLLRDAKMGTAVTNTLILSAFIVPLQIVLSLLMAMLLTREKLRGRLVFRLLNFLPYLTTPVAIGLFFSLLFDYEFGAVNHVLGSLGIAPVKWLTSAAGARGTICLVTVWRYFGYTMVLYMSGLMSISPEIHDAARVDGANDWQKFWRVTLPMLRNVNNFVILTTITGVMQLLEEPMLLFPKNIGGPEDAVLVGMTYMYNMGFGAASRMGYASAINYIMFVVITLVAVVTYALMQRGEERR